MAFVNLCDASDESPKTSDRLSSIPTLRMLTSLRQSPSPCVEGRFSYRPNMGSPAIDRSTNALVSIPEPWN
jgi:hypothetical protein